MPGPGDHNRPQAIAANPFEEVIPRISEYTAKEIATLQSRLDRQLGPEYISTRPGNGGGKVHYLAAEKVINLANEVFGFNGWSSQIKDVQIDFVDEIPNSGKISLGMSVIMRVSLRDGTYHEDIGYGHIENCKGKAAAFEKAKKEAATDALKRALRNFGNVLGNCLYDKDYLQKVTKVKIEPSRWDASNLHRHHDFGPVKPISKEAEYALPRQDIAKQERPAGLPTGRAATSNMSIEFEDDFGGNLFDGVELNAANDDDVSMGPENRPETPNLPAPKTTSNSRQPLQRAVSTGKMPPPQTVPAQNVVPPRNGNHWQQHQPNNQANNQANNETQNVMQQAQQQPQQQNAHGQQQQKHSTPPEQIPNQPQNMQQPTPQSLPQPPKQYAPAQIDQPPPLPALPAGHEPPMGFYTGRAAQLLAGGAPPERLAEQMKFNPNAESPSIRKTSGLNHAASKPLKRSEIAALSNGAIPAAGPIAAPTSAPVSNGAGPPPNFINPAANAGRQIGAPGGSGFSPHPMRTNAYKPPTMAAGAKRSYATSLAAAQVDGSAGLPPREPLKDVSNVAPTANGAVPSDVDGIAAKRLRSDA